jgi:hypothetical protein
MKSGSLRSCDWSSLSFFRICFSIPLTFLFSKLQQSFLSIRSSQLFHQNASSRFPETRLLFRHSLSCDRSYFLFRFAPVHQSAATFFRYRSFRFPVWILLTFHWMIHVLNKLPQPSSTLLFLAIERCFQHFKKFARYTDIPRFPDP